VGGPNSQPVTIPIDRLASFEVSRGNSRSLGAQRGVVWGSGVGLILALVALPSLQGCNYCSNTSGDLTSFVLYLTASGALYGAGIGALIGRERWEKFDLAPRPVTGIRAGRPSFGLSLQL
jgi:hypothetical protein